MGVERALSVCRLRVCFDDGQDAVVRAHGTGMRIGNDLLLTNHHVLHDWNANARRATEVEAWFGYELDPWGVPREHAVVQCDVASVSGNREQDWAVIVTTDPVPERFPILRLGARQAPVVDDRVYIIQHPEGGPKMIAMHHNLVRAVSHDVVQYWTDTKNGSSGSPVFNDHWEVIALHHRWVEAPSDDGMSYRNQGRRIERVIEGLTALGFAAAKGP